MSVWADHGRRQRRGQHRNSPRLFATKAGRKSALAGSLDHRRKETVGVLYVRKNPHVSPVAAAVGLFQTKAFAEWAYLEIGVVRQKSFHDILILRAQNRTRRIDQAPARSDERREALENRSLQSCKTVNVGFFNAPARLRLAPQDSGTGTGGVHDHSRNSAGQASESG